MIRTTASAAPLQFKFSAAGATGSLEGYAAVFGCADSHGDIIEPGAFRETLAWRERTGRGLPPMRKMHGPDPIGVWDSMTEDAHGLYVQGRVLGLNTAPGRQNWALIRDGALKGLSIGYKVRRERPGRGEVRRHLEAIDLIELSVCDEPSNVLARIGSTKAAGFGGHLTAISGYATLWNKPHLHPRTRRVEAFSRHCFMATVGGQPVQLIVNHDMAKPIASVADGSLVVLTTADGLAFRAELPSGPLTDEALQMIRPTGRTGCSVGYREIAVTERLIEGVPVRIIERAELIEISLVPRGAVDAAFATLADTTAQDWRERAQSKALLSDGAAARLRHEFALLGPRLAGVAQ